MVKIVHVAGPGNSGKTTSIKKYLEYHGIVINHGGDVLLALPIKRGSKSLVLGVASGGDTANIVRRNFKFFMSTQCDVIVCASKSRGGSFNEVGQQAQNMNSTVHQIWTVPVSTGTDAACDKIADEIDQNVS
tara:strand:- start:206 stop:601 length:396 start_codon:yes stop_codon:yes gene_type:complete